MRCRLICVVLVLGHLVACGPRLGRRGPLVEAPLLPLVEVRLISGEQMVWEVFWQGLSIGRAELRVGLREARSLFTTGTLASALAKIRHELITVLDEGGPRAATELLVHDGETTRTEAAIAKDHFHLGGKPRQFVPGGAPLHTLHTALGAVRAWARLDAPRAFLWLLVDGELYRLDVEPPARERMDTGPALRIASTVRGLDPAFAPIDVTIWLADTEDRTPVRFVVAAGEQRLSAELVESTATFPR